MKQICILLILHFSLNSYSQNCNIGHETNTSDFTTGGIFTPNILYGARHTLSQEGTLNSINLIGNDTGVNVQMAVYDDDSGVPNNLIATSNIGIVGSGVLSLPVTPILLPAGDYWIMAIYENEGRHTFTYSDIPGSNGLYYKEFPFGSAIPTNASDFTSCCNDESLYFLQIDCGNTLSIEQFNLTDKVSLKPNPASNFIQISFLTKTQKYKIYNALGMRISNGTITDGEKIDIKNFANGLYFLKFHNGKVMKFIKE